MSRYVMVLLLLAAACKDKQTARRTQCDQLVETSVAVLDGVARTLSPSAKPATEDPEIQRKMAELKQQCLTWPDDVFECVRTGDDTSPRCAEAMTQITGLTSAGVDKAPAGPAAVASADLGEVPWDGMPVAPMGDGTLVAAPKDAIVAFASTGAETWRFPLDHANWLLVAGPNVLVGDRGKHDVVALDAQTGTERWRVTVPVGEGEGERTTEGAVAVGDRIYVPIADGRFLRLDPTACAKKQRTCVAQAFRLADETLDDPQLAAVGGDLLIGESDAIRRISPTGTVRTRIHVRDTLGGMAIAGERLAAVIDDELVLFDLAKCGGDQTIELPRKSGRMYLRGEGECENCESAPPGCVVARTELSDVDAVEPTVLTDGSIAVANFDGVALVERDGAKRWVSEVDAVGSMRENNGALMFVHRDDTGAPYLLALDLVTGKAKWSTALSGVPGDITSTAEPIVEVAGPWIVAGAKSHVAWFKR